MVRGWSKPVKLKQYSTQRIHKFLYLLLSLFSGRGRKPRLWHEGAPCFPGDEKWKPLQRDGHLGHLQLKLLISLKSIPLNNHNQPFESTSSFLSSNKFKDSIEEKPATSGVLHFMEFGKISVVSFSIILLD